MKIAIATILYLLIGFFVNADGAINETYSLVGIILLSLVMIFDVTQKSSGIVTRIILIGLVIRFTVLYLDYGQVVSILHSGADSENFYSISYNNYKHPGAQPYYLTNYTVFLTYLFKLIGPQRLFAQFLNVIFGVYTILIADKCLSLFKCSRKQRIYSALLLSFLPNFIIFSSILLRESIIIFFTIWSFYFLLRWMKIGHLKNFVYSLLTLAPAVIMHSGMFGMLVGYLIIYSIYNQKTGQVTIGYKSWIPIILSGGVLVYILFFTDVLSYFGDVVDTSSNTISTEVLLEKQQIEGENSGSLYLKWLPIESLAQMIFFSPLKVFYFLFSPFIPDIRGMQDIIAFLLDSTFYLLTLYLIYKKKKQRGQTVFLFNRRRANLLMLPIWITIVLYSFGTFTSGTAMRHRANVFPELVVIAMLAIAEKKQFINNRWEHGEE